MKYHFFSFLKKLCNSKKERVNYLETLNGKVLIKIFANKKTSPQTPIIIIHGGPGLPHNYLLNLEALSENRAVIFYDQLGCGLSPCISDNSFWQIKRFVKELLSIVTFLGYKKVNLLGHSWGACVAAEFYFVYPALVKSLIFASPYLSAPLWMKDAQELIEELPMEYKIILEQSNKKQDYYSLEYQNAQQEYYKRYLYRLDPLPEVFSSSRATFGLDCYHYMWGTNEFTIEGSLKDYDASAKLSEIKVPTLYTCGRYDEARPETVLHFSKLTPKGEFKVFEDSAHFPHLNEKDKYLETIESFLIRNANPKD